MDESSSEDSDCSGATAIAARISMAYDDCADAIQQISLHARGLVVYEHDSDKEVSRTHIHMVIVEPDIGIEGFKKLVKRYIDVTGRKGNELWSWKMCLDVKKYITYMSKGSLAYKFCKEYSDEELETLRLQWVEREEKSDLPAKEVKYDEFAHILEDWGPADAKRVTFDEIRSWVFAWFWRRDGRIPPATQYKRMAGTLFLKIAEVQPQMHFGCAMEEVKNLWY